MSTISWVGVINKNAAKSPTEHMSVTKSFNIIHAELHDAMHIHQYLRSKMPLLPALASGMMAYVIDGCERSVRHRSCSVCTSAESHCNLLMMAMIRRVCATVRGSLIAAGHLDASASNLMPTRSVPRRLTMRDARVPSPHETTQLAPNLSLWLKEAPLH